MNHDSPQQDQTPDSVNVLPSKHSPGPWELIEGTEHHGPYVVNLYGAEVCDCYCMSNPTVASIRNGGTSYPVLFADAEANARLIAAAPDLLEACLHLVAQLEDALDGEIDPSGRRFIAGKSDLELKPDGSYLLSQARAVIARATGADQC